MVEDWYAFISEQPPLTLMTLFEDTVQEMHWRFLRDRYLKETKGEYAGLTLTSRQWDDAALKVMGDRHGLGYSGFPNVPLVSEPHFVSNWFSDEEDQRLRDWLSFKTTVLMREKPQYLMPVLGRMFWHEFLVQKYGTSVPLNQRCGTKYAQLYDVPFPPVQPESLPALLPVWRAFVDEGWPARLLRVSHTERYTDRWTAYLRERTSATYQEKLRMVGVNSYLARRAAFREVLGILPSDPEAQALPASPPTTGSKYLRVLWTKFAREQVAFEDKVLDVPEVRWSTFLQQKYGTVDRLPAGYGAPASFTAVAPPIRIVDFYEWSQRRSAIMGDFLTKNYKEVFAYIATRGRALPNTLVLVLLTLLTTLIVNPIAAYALSRFRLKQTQQILLFLIATMAFPAEISAIPGFLLMRDLHLLNTYWALIIPGLANGFSIFLLKGFFDSLPQELFESAELDGANEYVMFSQICLPLTTPILAVIALNAFVAAYSGWAWAMLACQKQEMWTLMVWLMQLQLEWNVSPSLIMASLVMASIPMLLMFVFAQNIIMRGVIVPEMK
ncbi:MAG: L-arabinose transport system permease protein AraQ [bacterium ADurb.Bin429]|nr:MAG: L-arabinose transport system permease protein AraQ [bacterium ADurb.Bin429]